MNRIDRLLARGLSLDGVLYELGWCQRRPAGKPMDDWREVFDLYGEIVFEGDERQVWNFIRARGGLAPFPRETPHELLTRYRAVRTRSRYVD